MFPDADSPLEAYRAAPDDAARYELLTDVRDRLEAGELDVTAVAVEVLVALERAEGPAGASLNRLAGSDDGLEPAIGRARARVRARPRSDGR